jgi:(1->4)-alpha-D-glucan 1-alpha-D-glucosylmutase
MEEGKFNERTKTPEIKRLKESLDEFKNGPGIKEREESKNIKETIKHSHEIRELIKAELLLINEGNGNPSSFDRLDKILSQQYYILSYWRTGVKALNYRRFFDINTLIGVRVELPEVMKKTHSLVYSLVHKTEITGLRIDHIDGLYDPISYLKELQREIDRFYIVVEDILSGDEVLPGNWPVYGTTGYDFGREVNSVFIDSQGVLKLGDHYSKMIGKVTNFKDVVYEKKKQVISDLFVSEIQSLGYHLYKLAKPDRHARDLTKQDIMQAIIEVTACLPIYRTYIRSFEVSPVDRHYLELSFDEARNRSKYLEGFALDFLRRVFFMEIPPSYTTVQRQYWLHMVMKWQQFTSAVTAKGLEDTALYTYNRLVSLNMIGVGLEQKEWLIDDFHNFNISRQAHWPLTLNATSTHDTKRSEDVQARINVISEKSQQWIVHLSWWRRWNYTKFQIMDGLQVPDPNTEEMLYQNLLGSWPLYTEEVSQYKERFKEYMLKAIREAKEHTNWIHPNEQYERAVLSFIDAILAESKDNEFHKEI